MTSAPGTLHLVGTPIGHRDDLAPRARAVLAATRVVACEDTRTARKLFAWLGLPAPELVAYHDHNARSAAAGLVARLEAGDDVALVTDAGMPAIQDPGYRLVVAARERRIRVVPVPGPSALLLALAASGLPTDRFAFLGYAPRRGREAWWNEALARAETVVVYESPRRLTGTLEAVAAIDPGRPVSVARELTKIHEEFVGGSAAEVAAELGARAEVRGECVLVVAGSSAPAAGAAAPWREALTCLGATRAGGSLSPRDRVEVLACAYPSERNAIYRAVLEESR
ncbi:MAG TPA: 16S rRNA (cytidine(1402)-2'-O)-methyltransferase [Gemmatimonadota bacterium]|nr:16S rRNA (cytidine(1402)-2'-O)-methyltransferase [Gemmatimonadota bacterium]